MEHQGGCWQGDTCGHRDRCVGGGAGGRRGATEGQQKQRQQILQRCCPVRQTSCCLVTPSSQPPLPCRHPPCCLPLCFADPQGRLNQIDVVVNLKMHQIEYLVDGRLPTDLTQGLVFSDKELEKLKRRIEVRSGCSMEGSKRARGGRREEKLRRRIRGAVGLACSTKGPSPVASLGHSTCCAPTPHATGA